MSNELKRYEPVIDFGRVLRVRENADGDYVLHSDALAAIEAAKPKWLDIHSAPKDEDFLFQTGSGSILTGCILDSDHPDCEYDGGVHESWSHQYVESAVCWLPLPQKASK